MPCVWCLVPGSYQTTRRQRPLTAPIHDRSIAENSINLILSRHLGASSLTVIVMAVGLIYNIRRSALIDVNAVLSQSLVYFVLTGLLLGAYVLLVK